MQTKREDIKGSGQRRSAEIERIRASIQATADLGRAARERDPAAARTIAPLLVRLDEIREELDRLAILPATPITGDLYPFWIQLALRGSA